MQKLKKLVFQELMATKKGTKVTSSIKKEFKDATNVILGNIADEVGSRVKGAGFKNSGDMNANSRIFGHEVIKENVDSVVIKYGFNVGNDARRNWNAGGWHWNFFEFKSPNNRQISILDSVLSGLSDKIKKQFKKELSE